MASRATHIVKPVQGTAAPVAAPFAQRLLGAAARSLIFAVGILPAPLAYGIANVGTLGLAAWTAIRGLKPRNSGFYRNYRIVYRDAGNARHRRRLLLAWSRHLMHLGVDFCRLARVNAGNYRRFIDPTDYEKMRDALREGKGLIGATGHVGFFEMGGFIAPLEGVPTVAVFNDSPIGPVTDVVSEIRSACGMQILRRDGATRAMLKTLRAGVGIGFAVDIATKRNPVFVPFLGTLAATNRMAAVLHLKTGAPIFVHTTTRVGRMKFKFHVWDVIRYHKTDDLEACATAIMARVNGALSRAIMAHPEQWFWQSRRFRFRPEGEAPLPDGLPPVVEQAVPSAG